MATTTLPDRRVAPSESDADRCDEEAPPPRFGSALDAIWASRIPNVVFAAALAAAYGLIGGLWTPRGPVTSREALAAMALGAAVGVGAGAIMRSRWAMLVAPVVFVAVFELVRLDATGPTVDAPAASMLSTQLGMVALVAGRGFHGILTLFPMVVGASFGRSWATRHRSRSGGGVGRSVFSVSVTLLVLLAVALVRPATTEAIRGADGQPIAGSIAELTTVDIGGHSQSMLIRGHDATDPVVLFLAGGPGGSEVGTMSERARVLEQDFVVVTWDQLGTGGSAGQYDPDRSLSIERAVTDTIEVTDYLRDRFAADRVYLVGNSYGTLLGARAAQQRPDLYAAFVGVGQMVDPVETDQIFYEDALAHADAVGDTAGTDALRDNGPPPYDDLLKMAPLVASEHDWNDYSDIDGFPGMHEPTEHLLVPEYSLMDMVRSMAGMLDTYEKLYPELYDTDLRKDVTELEVPVFLVQGAHEARGRAEPAREWFDQLDAPTKEWIEFDRSGHRPWVQEPDRFAEVMTGTVLASVDPGAVVDGTPAVPEDDADELRNLFAEYNPDVWPLHLLAYAVGLGMVALILRRPGARTDQLVSMALAGTWGWLGVVFFGRYTSQLDPLLSAIYGALFVFEAALLLRAAVGDARLQFRSSNRVAGRIGWSAIAYALVVYPVLGIALGHGYPEAPLFGMAPCPTTIATFGFLLLALPRLPKRLLVIPTIWAVLAPLAAVGHGYPEDLGLVVIAIAAWVCVLLHRRRARDDTPEDPTRTTQASSLA